VIVNYAWGTTLERTSTVTKEIAQYLTQFAGGQLSKTTLEHRHQFFNGLCAIMICVAEAIWPIFKWICCTKKIENKGSRCHKDVRRKFRKLPKYGANVIIEVRQDLLYINISSWGLDRIIRTKLKSGKTSKDILHKTDGIDIDWTVKTKIKRIQTK
jgi:hypothetical protein